MNKVILSFFLVFFLLINNLLASLFDNGLFIGYKTRQNTHHYSKDNNSSSGFLSVGKSYNDFRFPNSLSKSNDNVIKLPTLSYGSEKSTYPLNLSNREIFNQDNSNKEPRYIQLNNKNYIEINRDNNNDENTNGNINTYDSGIPVEEVNSNTDTNTNDNYNQNQYNNNRAPQKNNNPNYGNVDTSVYHSQLPSSYMSGLNDNNSYNPRKLVYKKNTKYPNFLLFADDVICTTERGIVDGMIFYTPHGTYKLKGNLLISSNDSYLISGNKIWLDNMLYYFDDNGVYLNNKIYRFVNNEMYKDGIKYKIEGTVVTAQGVKGNRRCIVSELVE